jgi:hypothetical protein
MGLMPRRKLLSYNLVIRVKLATACHQLKHGVYNLQTVLHHTNERISRRTTTYKLKSSHGVKTAVHELRAFIGLLYLAGVLKAGLDT